MNNDLEEDDQDIDEFGDEEGPSDQAQEAISSLRRNRQAARPSMIVQVNTGALELHLTSLKKKIQLLEKEVHNPIWLESIQKEINEIPPLKRRIEHCELDINAIREAIFSNKNGDTTNTKPLGMDTMKYIFAEINTAKAITRRIELHQALEAKMYSKVQDMQLQIKRLGENNNIGNKSNGVRMIN
jgi:hypothetical protein